MGKRSALILLCSALLTTKLFSADIPNRIWPKKRPKIQSFQLGRTNPAKTNPNWVKNSAENPQEGRVTWLYINKSRGVVERTEGNQIRRKRISQEAFSRVANRRRSHKRKEKATDYFLKKRILKRKR